MPVFEWEQRVSDYFKTLPHEGALYHFMFFFSHPGGWGVVLAISFFLVLYRKKVFSMLPLLVFIACAVGTSDLLSRRIIKVSILRLRPGYLGQHCEGSQCWGFMSSHAMNMATIATLFICLDRRNAWWALPIVFLVCLSRVYIIDHYPLDVICGAILGIGIGLLYWLAYQKLILERMPNSESN